MATLLLHHSTFANHKTSDGHPERPDRYRAVEAVLGKPQFDALVREKAEVADLDTTRYVHTNRYVDALEAARPNDGYVYLDGGDTMMEPSTWEVVLRGVGATIQAVEKVLAGEVQNAFVACRPPGHHAESERAMGFCLFNNIGIGARHAQRNTGWSASRPPILTSTMATARRRSSTPIQACSTPRPIRCRFFSGTGAARETGVGNIFNAPLAPGDGGAELREAFEGKILSALDTFKPDLIIVSAGVRCPRTRSARFAAHDGGRFRLGHPRTDEIG